MTKYFIETPDGRWLMDPILWSRGSGLTRDPFKAWAFDYGAGFNFKEFVAETALEELPRFFISKEQHFIELGGGHYAYIGTGATNIPMLK